MAVIAESGTGGTTYVPPKVPTYSTSYGVGVTPTYTAYKPPPTPTYKPPPTPTYTPYVAPYTHEETRSEQYDRTTTVAPTPAPVTYPATSYMAPAMRIPGVGGMTFAPTGTFAGTKTPAPAPSQTLDTRLYELEQFGTPPTTYTHEDVRMAQEDRVTTVPEQQYSIFGEPIDLEGPIGLSFADQPIATGPSEFYKQGGLPQAIAPQLSPATDFYIQGGLPQAGVPTVTSGLTEQQMITEAARLTGQAIFNYGQIPNVISTAVANELPYTYYGYSSADQLLKDLGYFEKEPGQWIQGDPGAGTIPSGTTGATVPSGTTSYRSATSGGGYTGRYAGASTGLIHWRIGF